MYVQRRASISLGQPEKSKCSPVKVTDAAGFNSAIDLTMHTLIFLQESPGPSQRIVQSMHNVPY